jgi:hypothetical protein
MSDVKRYGLAFAVCALVGFLGTVAFLGPPGNLEPPVEVVKSIRLPIPKLVRSAP